MNMIKKKADKKVAIVMGSKSDYPIMKFCEKTLKNRTKRTRRLRLVLFVMSMKELYWRPMRHSNEPDQLTAKVR